MDSTGEGLNVAGEPARQPGAHLIHLLVEHGRQEEEERPREPQALVHVQRPVFRGGIPLPRGLRRLCGRRLADRRIGCQWLRPFLLLALAAMGRHRPDDAQELD
jgi:hypothetical protein